MKALMFLLASIVSVNSMTIRAALSQVESGDNDSAIGTHGEVSRFQIMPHVWRTFGRKLNPRKADAAWFVAEKVLEARTMYFEGAFGRKPTARELYALWNAPGMLAHARGNLTLLPKKIQERCERFENLVNSTR